MVRVVETFALGVEASATGAASKTSDGIYTIYSFTNSTAAMSLMVSDDTLADILIVGGGGGGWRAGNTNANYYGDEGCPGGNGGGGAGGVLDEVAGVDGTSGTGGGGGGYGVRSGNFGTAGAGGSGIVIVRLRKKPGMAIVIR